MNIKTKRFLENLKVTFKNLGNSTEKILQDLENADKEMQKKIDKATGSVK